MPQIGNERSDCTVESFTLFFSACNCNVRIIGVRPRQHPVVGDGLNQTIHSPPAMRFLLGQRPRLGNESDIEIRQISI